MFWYISSLQPFWHQGSVLWKTIFPQTVAGGWFWDDLSALHLLYTLFLLLLHCDNVVMWAMGSSCKYRWSFSCSPTTHLLLCSLVPNRPWTGTSLWPRVWGPLPLLYINKIWETFSQEGLLAYNSKGRFNMNNDYLWLLKMSVTFLCFPIF